MTLENAWNLLESLNDDANKKSKDIWNSDVDEAIRYQSSCFRENFLRLDKHQQKLIIGFIKTDDEFRDYFECLSSDMFENVIGKH